MIILERDRNKTFYPATSEYNLLQVMEELKNIIIENGGRVKQSTPFYIQNRTLDSNIRYIELKIETLKSKKKTDKLLFYVAKLEKELSELKQINNKPVLLTQSGYISFIHDNKYYYLQFDSNPFFPFYFYKTPITNGIYSKDATLEELNKESWLFDCFLKYDCNAENYRAAAKTIFEQLIESSNSAICRKSTKRRVHNTYNNRYHYESIFEPERKAKIDF